MDNKEYIKIIIDFVNNKYDKFYNNRFKKMHVYNYCLVNKDANMDSQQLFSIINYVLNFLTDNGYLMKFKHIYMTINRVDLDLFKNSKCKIKRQEMRKYVTNNKK